MSTHILPGRPQNRPLLVLFISGTLGFAVGMFKFPTWQVAVETAQVVAHLVKYPEGNPFYIYHTKLWTILHQICALLLLSGLSEGAVSKLLSGVLAMVSFQALAMTVYAISADALMAIGAALVIFFSRIAEHGVVYPISLTGFGNTYGTLGLSLIVLVAGLLGAGCSRLAGFLLGLAPAVHAALGVWLWLTVALTLVWDFDSLRHNQRPLWRYVLAGCLVTAASLLTQLVVTYDVPHVDSEVSSRYVRAFIGFWDAHRRPVNAESIGVLLNVGALTLCAIWLAGFSEKLSSGARFILRMVIVTGALSLTFVPVSWIGADYAPLPLLVLMPGRLLNFNAMIYVALLFGLLGLHRDRLWSQSLTVALAGGLLLNRSGMLWDSPRQSLALSTPRLDGLVLIAGPDSGA